MYPIMAGIMVLLALWVVLRDLIPSKVNLFFPWMRGGIKTRDSLGLIETVSIEVRRVGHDNAHSQSYIFKEPIIEFDEKCYRATGFLESFDQGKIPVRFDILKFFYGDSWDINFRVSFDSELSGVEMVKAWCWIKADDCVMINGSGYHAEKIQPAPKKWVQLYEGNLQSVKFSNRSGSVKITSSDSPQFKVEQVWKHDAHSEYVSLWVMEPKGITIEKGSVFEGLWSLKFRGD